MHLRIPILITAEWAGLTILLLCIFNTFWANGSGPNVETIAASSDSRINNSISYGCVNGSGLSQFTESSPACGDGIDAIVHSNPTPQGIPQEMDSCLLLQDKGEMYFGNLQNRKAYDTLKSFVEKCPLYETSPSAFSLITTSAVGLFQERDTVWLEYRDWLKKVLYYNPDSGYYCADLREYARTFLNFSNIGPVPDLTDYRTTIAILTYLRDSSHCRVFVEHDLDGTKDNPYGLWWSYRKHWQDTVKDQIKTPFDSTLPPLDSIGMGWLRGFARDVKNGEFDIYPNAISELTATKNPFSDEIELQYNVIKPTVAKLEIYDALGRMLWTDGQGYLEPRKHSAKINASQWSSGSYYARIVTLQGEVKTCKLVKE